jgi:hypothetical protein
MTRERAPAGRPFSSCSRRREDYCPWASTPIGRAQSLRTTQEGRPVLAEVGDQGLAPRSTCTGCCSATAHPGGAPPATQVCDGPYARVEPRAYSIDEEMRRASCRNRRTVLHMFAANFLETHPGELQPCGGSGGTRRSRRLRCTSGGSKLERQIERVRDLSSGRQLDDFPQRRGAASNRCCLRSRPVRAKSSKRRPFTPELPIS